MTTTQKTTDEGPRSFLHFLRDLADGAANVDLSQELHELCKLLLQESKSRNDDVSGELTLKIRLGAEPNGFCNASYSVAVKKPAPRRAAGHFWLTQGGNLSTENPRQMDFPTVREVKGNADDAPRDVAQEG